MISWLHQNPEWALIVIVAIKVLHSLTPEWKAWPTILKPLGALLQVLSGETMRKGGK